MAYGARLESGLSESSQGFESPILRQPDLERRPTQRKPPQRSSSSRLIRPSAAPDQELLWAGRYFATRTLRTTSACLRLIT